MTLAATTPPPCVTVTKSVKNKKSAADVTITITEDIYFDCDQHGKCTPTATSFSGPTATAKVSSKKHHHSGSSKKGHKTATTKLPGHGNGKGKAKSTPTPPC
jgi:hypothetical protein